MISFHTIDPIVDNVDDDDDMPPLVDNPNPSMTFTFFTDMSPITADTTDPTAAPYSSHCFSINGPPSAFDDMPPLVSADGPEMREANSNGHLGAGAKPKNVSKRDASYIPRPPNAFILFRSSFIKSQQVPEKVEGNHSTLSKIIGKYWKTLSKEEREVWEAKAVNAQVEHRQRYPDWRFRPGSNALAKLKIKDGGVAFNGGIGAVGGIGSRGGGGTGAKGRNKNGSGGGGGAKGVGKKARGKSDAGVTKKKHKLKDERCAKIADLLMEGKTGVDLADAMKKWEDGGRLAADEDHGVINPSNNSVVPPPTVIASTTHLQGPACEGTLQDAFGGAAHGSGGAGVASYLPTRCKTPEGAPDARFDVPLTSMFRRSFSAPAGNDYSHAHAADGGIDDARAHVAPPVAGPTTQSHVPVFTFSSGGSLDCGPMSANAAYPADNHISNEFYGAGADDAGGQLSPLMLPSAFDGRPARWNDPYNLLETSLPANGADCPALTYDSLTSPINSPNTPSYGDTFSSYSSPATPLDFNDGTSDEPPTFMHAFEYDYSIMYGGDGHCVGQQYQPDQVAYKGWDNSVPLQKTQPYDAYADGGVPVLNQQHQYAAESASPAPQPAIYEWSPFEDSMRCHDIYSLADVCQDATSMQGMRYQPANEAYGLCY